MKKQQINLKRLQRKHNRELQKRRDADKSLFPIGDGEIYMLPWVTVIDTDGNWCSMSFEELYLLDSGAANV